MKRKWVVLVEALLAGLLVFLLTLTGAFSGLDYMVRDKLYQIPRGIDGDIKIIGIDEKTLNAYGQIQTWSRERYAQLIRKLNSVEDAKPMLIGFDIRFLGNVDEGDAVFAEACRESKNVVTVSQLNYDDRLVENEAGELVNVVQ